MSNNVDSKGVTISVKIYERLLATYPADFRREYGPAMKQLFRDQCRDAWSQAQGRGLAILWLRMLPDLAKTLLVEHLINLSQRAAFIRVFAVVFAGAFVASAIVAYSTRPIYLSTAEVLVRKGDPYFVTTQFTIIESHRILTTVITNLNLQHVLAIQAGQSDWSLDKTYNDLFKQVGVADPHGSSIVIGISVKNANPDMAAKIANAIVGAYREMPSAAWVNVIDHARPDPNSAFRTKLKIFKMRVFGGTLVALVAGGASAWLTYLIRRFSHRQCTPP